MKKIVKTILAFAATSLLAISCSNDLSDTKASFLASLSNNNSNNTFASRGTADFDLTVYLLGAPKDYSDYRVWAWLDSTTDVNYTPGNWPGEMNMTTTTISGYSAWTYTLTIDNTANLGILFNCNSGKTQTKDITIPAADIVSTLYFNWNSMAYYTNIDDCVGLMGAEITTLNSSAGTAIITGTSSLLDNGDIEVTVVDSTEAALSVTSAKVSNDVLTIEVENSTGSVSNQPYKITYNGKTLVASISSSLIESLYATNAASQIDTLGLTIDGSDATFKVWAPTASDAKVILYTSSSDAYDTSRTNTFDNCGKTTTNWETAGVTSNSIQMTFDTSNGIWSGTTAIGSYKYYKYQLTIGGTDYFVCDIWNGVAGPDSNASQIVSIDDSEATPTVWESGYTNPFGSTGSETKKYNDAVIYEMHIRDWSRATVANSTGKFSDFASDDVISHLQNLGVTHVQILPMFDYAQINSNTKYNWGYNPYNYNVPEGRYVTDGYSEGTDAVKEMRAMIKKLHDAGIAVIMDVVYNHTSATGEGSLYDSTVPGYFYRQDSSGNYINGSGCGNELATNHAMVKAFVIDSLKHWMNDYHINGFRFDLMGCLESSTMKDIYEALYAIDKNVLVYGEPWTGGTSGVEDGAIAAGAADTGYGFGAFDDDYRDAVKGAEFGGFNIGQIQGSYSTNIETGLKGEVITKNNRNATGISGLALHYAECHDNFTLYDKLVYSLDLEKTKTADSSGKIATVWPSTVSSSDLELIKKQVKLAGAYLMLSQGTPFLNGGQEFLRTKKGNPDSYAADTKGGVTWTNTAGSYNIDDVNTIDLSMKDTYSDVYNTYKGLIALRKANDAFTNPSSVTASNEADGITKYTANSSSGKSFEVYFNATSADWGYLTKNGSVLGAGVKDISFTQVVTGKVVTISEDDGTVSYADSSSSVSVPAKGFVILWK